MVDERRASWLGHLRKAASTIRVRTTVAGVAVVGVALVAGAVALMLMMRSTLTEQVRSAALLRAAEVAAALEAGTPLDGLAADDDELIQVLDARGAVVAVSANLAGGPPVANLRPGESAAVGVPFEDDPFLAVAVSASTPKGLVTVVVARTLDTVEESTRIVGGLLLVGIPLLIVVMAATTWRLVGRALAPVEAIREEVEGISASELHRRVPVPAGGDEISRLAATMNRMLEGIESAQRRQRRFISDASHELRSPVASIRQHAEVALAHPQRTDAVELAETVLAEDLRVQRLVEDMLLLARADEHMLHLRRRPVDLDDLVLEEGNRLRATTALEVEMSNVSAGRVEGDVTHLQRALRNVTENAARHAHRRVSLSLGEKDGEVVLGVEDDGPGIPLSDREVVFERFVRLDDARARDAGGSGLGFAIVAEIVAAHRGTVGITDSPLGGARIEIRLPGLDLDP